MFNYYRENIVGIENKILTKFGEQTMLYADWTASGRFYKPMEEYLLNDIYPYVGNTHSEASYVSKFTTELYNQSVDVIKKHFNADDSYALISYGSGTTQVINKFQRMLRLKEQKEKPVVFITHMEHHSNHLSWIENGCDVVVVPPDEDNDFCLENLEEQLKIFKDRKLKIGSFTACSNVTGIETPIYQMANLMHEYGGYCFADLAAIAPYRKFNVCINDDVRLDAIFYSSHKFLGGVGASGILIFHKSLYKNDCPDIVGGGIVKWSNAWNEYSFVSPIEDRENAGTLPFIQTIRAGMAISLKEEMGVGNMIDRDEEIVAYFYNHFPRGCFSLNTPNIEGLPIFSFYIKDIHYNLVVKCLNDFFGIQARGGCMCAATYGHYLLGISKSQSKEMTDKIDNCDLSGKQGWIRLSFHPTTTNEEVMYVCNALKKIIRNKDLLKKFYDYDLITNEFHFNQSFSLHIDLMKG